MSSIVRIIRSFYKICTISSKFKSIIYMISTIQFFLSDIHCKTHKNKKKCVKVKVFQSCVIINYKKWRINSLHSLTSLRVFQTERRG